MPSKSSRSSRRQRCVALGISVTAALALAACSSSGSASPAGGSTLVVVTPDQGTSWAIDAAYSGGDLEQNTQATLVRKPYVASKASKADEQDIYKFTPYLADSYDVSKDKLTYTFHLDTKVRSAAGNPLTAEDVIWSYERKFGTATSITPSLSKPEITDPAKQFKAINSHTVSIHVAAVSSGFTMLALLSDVTGQIYDAKYLMQHVTKSDPYAVTWSTSHPNYGFGPYKVQSYTTGKQATLVANPGWTFNKLTYTKIISRIIPDAGQRVNAVKSGQADIAESLPEADLASMEKDSSVFVPAVDSPNLMLTFAMVTNKAPFNNVLVRQAMAYAVPYTDIIKDVYHGRAVRNTPGILPGDTPGYDQSKVTDYTYDPAKAKALLKQAGFPNGISYKLSVSAGDASLASAAIEMQSQAKAAGIKITPDIQPASAFQQGLSAHTFQASLGQDAAVTMAPAYELNLYTTPHDQNNRGDWSDPAFQAAVSQGIASGDPLSPKAGKYWTKAMAIYMSQVPVDYIARFQPDLALSSKISGFAWRTDNIVDYSNLTHS
jgi:peptide/nickel transport system substrate-binding protein